jgi:hypothetical protein
MLSLFLKSDVSEPIQVFLKIHFKSIEENGKWDDRNTAAVIHLLSYIVFTRNLKNSERKVDARLEESGSVEFEFFSSFVKSKR